MGTSSDTKTSNSTYHWSVSYWEGLGEYAAMSLTYINEGHQPNHYRDGLAPQIWARLNFLDRRLSLAAGIGPYAYFSTDVSPVRDIYKDNHGLGLISSLAATWYGASPLLFQVRANYIQTSRSFDSLSATFGIGYQLEPSSTPGPVSRPSPQYTRATDNEIILYAGQTVLNSAKSEHGTTMSIEYRRGITPHLDWTIAWLDEGNARPIGRSGVTTQIWAVRSFFDDHLVLGFGLGPYFARDKYSRDHGVKSTTAGLASLTARYRFNNHWGIRAVWGRVITNYDRDTDIFVGGLSFLF